MLMILLSILSVIRHLICGNILNWLLNLNLIYETLWIVDFNAGKTLLVSFHQSNSNGTINVKMDGSIIEEIPPFKKLRLTFSSKLVCGSYIFSIAKTASKKIGALIRFTKFFSPEFALTARKLSKYGVTSGLYFPVFGLNMERYSMSLRIQSEYRKKRIRSNSVFGHFSCGACISINLPYARV